MFFYLAIGLIVFLAVKFISIGVGIVLGSGLAEVGIIVSAISVQCAIIVVCTLKLIDAIKSSKQIKN